MHICDSMLSKVWFNSSATQLFRCTRLWYRALIRNSNANHNIQISRHHLGPYHRNSPFWFCPAASFAVSAGFSSGNPRFLNSSFAMRFLQISSSVGVCNNNVRLQLPIHPTCQIRLCDIPTLRIVHPSLLLHTCQVTCHDSFALPFTIISAMLRCTKELLRASGCGQESRTIVIEREATALRSAAN